MSVSETSRVLTATAQTSHVVTACHFVCVCGQGYVVSSREEMSQLAAELYAIVCVECRDPSVNLVNVITQLVTDTRSQVSLPALSTCSSSLIICG